MTIDKKRIAYFISPHGFGHAARAGAVMEALSQVDAAHHFEIFTTVPAWFFKDSLSVSFTYHSLLTDIGLVQKTAFQTDLNETIRALDGFYPLKAARIAEIAAAIMALGCGYIFCDIAPLGIQVAKESGIPSVLVENFTWDWIYQQYAAIDDRIQRHIDYLQPWFNAADYHIQTEPVCSRWAVDLITVPVSRRARSTKDTIRKRLGASATDKLVLITTGGVPESYGFVAKLNKLRQIRFVIPGGARRMRRQGNVIILPRHSDFYHPDLVNAADVVVGKSGYSTIAEVFHAGVPFGYVPRPNFRESDLLVKFIERNMPGIAVEESEFRQGDWIAKLDDLLSLSPRRCDVVNGAEQIGKFIAGLRT